MKKIFINRYGLVRSGWILLIGMFLYYALQFALSSLGIGALRKILVMTGHINDAIGYYSPLANKIGVEVLPFALQILTEIITIAIPLVTCKVMKYRLRDIGLGDFRLKFKKEGVLGLLLGAGFCTLIFLVLLFTNNVRIDSIHLTLSASLVWYAITFLLIGFAEELFNRGLLMSVLRRSNNPYLIILLPSVIFGCIHLMNPNVTVISIVNIILIGIVFSAIYYKSGNLWLCIGYHITWNLFQSVVYGMPVSGLNVTSIVVSHYPTENLLNGGGFGIEGGILTTVATILLFVFAMFYYRNSEYRFLPDPHIAPQMISKAN